MALYIPQPSKQGDAAAMGNSLAAADTTIANTFGNCVVSGLVLNTSGTITAGVAIVGHTIKSSSASLSSLFAGTGVFDLYACQPVGAYNSTTGIMTTGTYPDSTGTDAINFVVVPTGTSPAHPGAKLCTVTVASGTISTVVDERTMLSTILGAGGITALTGDVTGSGSGSVATTLASVGSAATKGSASRSATLTTDTKGRVTSLSDSAIAIDASQVTTGVLSVARIATGTPDGTKFVRDDGTLQHVPVGSTTLAADTDVSLSSPANGDVLTYESGVWINQPITPVTSVLDRILVDGSGDVITSGGSVVYY